MKLEPNPNRIDVDEAYLQMAGVWAKRSKANRRQVGCLIVKDNQIISDGYNGLLPGVVPDICETIECVDGKDVLVSKSDVIHAELNAIAKLAKNGSVSSSGATAYITLSPCLDCARIMASSGIRRVVYREQYRDTSGIEFLKSYGVVVDKV